MFENISFKFSMIYQYTANESCHPYLFEFYNSGCDGSISFNKILFLVVEFGDEFQIASRQILLDPFVDAFV
jgi:hypothetical protein